MAIELGEQPVDRAGWHNGVAVQQEDVRPPAGADADVVRAREAGVRADLDHADAGPSARSGGAPVGRSVVDHEDFVERIRRRGVQRLEAALEIRPRVERHDDD